MVSMWDLGVRAVGRTGRGAHFIYCFLADLASDDYWIRKKENVD